jgi:hypothetical protein
MPAPPDVVVLDANVLVLLVVGMASASYISRHKRLRAYTEADYHLLTTLLPTFSRIVVTPHTVAETSNLAGQIAEPARTHVFEVLAALLQEAVEVYVQSRDAAKLPAFRRLGATDAALLLVTDGTGVLLTADLDLYLEAGRLGRQVVNFTHVIEANGPSQ